MDVASSTMSTLSTTLTYATNIYKNREKLLNILNGGSSIWEFGKIILNGVEVGPEILAEFSKLHNKIQAVNNDIRELGLSIEWVGTSIQYADICDIISLGMEYCELISKHSRDGNASRLYEDKLKELCSGEKLMLALRALFNGLAGRGEFTISIIDTVYKKTQGHRLKVDEFCCNLLQLFVGGLAVLLTHQTLITNENDAKTLEQNHFSGSYNSILKNINTTLQKCKDEFLTNAEKDIACILDHPSSTDNTRLINGMHAKLSEKYGWVQFDCMLWDDCKSRLFNLNGNFISKLHYQGKCAVAFYYYYAETVYDTPYKRAWNMVNNQAKVWQEEESTTFDIGIFGMTAPIKCCKFIEQFMKGKLQYSGYAVWLTDELINPLAGNFNVHYVVDAKCYSGWSIWHHGEVTYLGLKSNKTKGKTIYCRIRSVDREHFRNPPKQESCVVS